MNIILAFLLAAIILFGIPVAIFKLLAKLISRI